MSTLDNLRKAAKRWLRALRAHDANAVERLRQTHPHAPANPGLRDVQHGLARERGFESWNALKDAHTVGGASRYAGLAEDLVAAYQSGDGDAVERLRRRYGRVFTLDELRDSVRRGLAALPETVQVSGDFALPHARLLVAREFGFEDWAALEASSNEAASPAGSEDPASDLARPAGSKDPASGAPMIQPIEMRTPLPYRWQGLVKQTADVWEMLSACRLGELERVTALVDACPALALCDYNYMSPLHLAVREGHRELVRYLVDRGAANPNYVTYPYRETLVTVARDRGYDEIATILEERYRTGDRSRKEDEGGEIDYPMDDEARRFQKLLNSNAVAEIGAILQGRPELATNPFAFWSEGVLMMPAKLGNLKVIELLMRHGARVPDVSKWGAWYYLWIADVAAWLLERGMNANHMNCHRTTVLHDMAYKGDTQKASLLLAHGADVNAIDEEFRSTPLGLAARWGHAKMVTLLLEHGADPNLSGAAWATPLEWARKKGHAGIESQLRAGAAS